MFTKNNNNKIKYMRIKISKINSSYKMVMKIIRYTLLWIVKKKIFELFIFVN